MHTGTTSAARRRRMHRLAAPHTWQLYPRAAEGVARPLARHNYLAQHAERSCAAAPPIMVSGTDMRRHCESRRGVISATNM